MLILTTVLLAACSKYPHEDPFIPGPPYNIPDEFRAWTVFNAGSWWAYKNEKSNIIDTTKCIHGAFYNQELCGNCPVIEYIWFFLKGSVATRYDIEGGKNENASLKIMRDGFSETLAFTYKTLADSAQSDSSGWVFDYQFIERMDSFILNGNTFSNVYHTRLSWKESYYGPPKYLGYDYYFARNIGLILLKKNYPLTDTTWSLMNWYTVQ